MLTMAVFTITTLLACGVIAAVLLQRLAAARERARQLAAEETQVIQRADQKLADTVADNLAAETPIAQIVADTQRERAALLPAAAPRPRPYDWTDDDLAQHQSDRADLRCREAQRRSTLALVVLAAGGIVFTVVVNAVLYSNLYANQKSRGPATGPAVLPASAPPASATNPPPATTGGVP